jgi:hypothetical protein
MLFHWKEKLAASRTIRHGPKHRVTNETGVLAKKRSNTCRAPRTLTEIKENQASCRGNGGLLFWR